MARQGEDTPLVSQAMDEQEAPKSAKAELEKMSADLLALPEAQAVLPGAEDGDFTDDAMHKFINAWVESGVHEKMGDMEGFSNCITAAKSDPDGSGNVDETEQAAAKDEAKDKIDAATQFMMNVNVVVTLLVTVQLGLVLTEADMHPMMTAALNKLEEWMNISCTWYHDTAYITKGSKMEEAVEVHFLTYLAQHVATLFMLRSIMQNLSLVVKTSKAYGHIMYWAADLETKLWYAETGQILWVQGYINQAGTDFLISLVPYVCITRGPIIAAAFVLVARFVGKDFNTFNLTGATMLLLHQAKKVKQSSVAKSSQGPKTVGNSR